MRVGGVFAAVLASWMAQATAADGGAEREAGGGEALPSVEVTARRVPDGMAGGMFPEADAARTLPLTLHSASRKFIDERQPDRAEDALVELGVGLPWRSSSGYQTALVLRGFTMASRVMYDNHPDIQRFFVRDLATVERIEVLKGSAALLHGQGAPGGTVNYIGKRAYGAARYSASASLGSDDFRRVEADIRDGAGPFLFRAVYAGQESDTLIDRVNNDRWSAFLVAELPYGNGSNFRVERETQHNHRPFSFGTVYVNGRFLYDRSFVGPQAHSDRRYRRSGVYWDHAFAGGAGDWSVHAAFSQAEVARNERLVGFWTVASPTRLSGYYRELTDRFTQDNLRLEVRGKLQTGFMSHRLNVGVQKDRQSIDFNGPQNIAGFSLDIENPVFPADLSPLKLKPRISLERHREGGVFAYDRVAFGEEWNVLLGARRSGLRIDADSTGAGYKAVSDFQHTELAWGVVRTLGDDWRVHLSRTESFEPNRGQDRFGNFLAPKEGRQYEIGLGYEPACDAPSGRTLFRATAFDIVQSNLTGTDPLDKTALIALGVVRSRGVEVEARRPFGGGLSAFANLTWQRVENVHKASPGLGSVPAGIPGRFGVLGVDWLPGGMPGFKTWINLVVVDSRPGDAGNSFLAPGYGRVNWGSSYRMGRDSELLVNVVNLLDKRYVEAITASDDVYQGDRRRVVLTFRHAL